MEKKTLRCRVPRLVVAPTGVVTQNLYLAENATFKISAVEQICIQIVRFNSYYSLSCLLDALFLGIMLFCHLSRPYDQTLLMHRRADAGRYTPGASVACRPEGTRGAWESRRHPCVAPAPSAAGGNEGGVGRGACVSMPQFYWRRPVNMCASVMSAEFGVIGRGGWYEALSWGLMSLKRRCRWGGGESALGDGCLAKKKGTGRAFVFGNAEKLR